VGDGQLSTGTIVLLAWAGGGFGLGLFAAAHEHRREAREDAARLAEGGRPVDRGGDVSPALMGLVAWVFAPLGVITLVGIGLFLAFDRVTKRLARVDRMPEVRAARLKEMERDAGL
jgi:type IV secretory pathway TrbD component